MVTIEDRTAWDIHTGEARYARLRSLADSINDTARTARTSLSLFLIVALYLFLTLISSTDENLLRNSLVELPQVGAGISLENSYIFAPLIFLYLHAQLLFLLSVLARKVQTFKLALEEEFPGAASPNKQRDECRDWLSAFAFVQLFRPSSGGLHASKILVWLGIEAIPVVLLFVLDLSFVRYQSDLITWEHHIIFVIDVVLLAWFNCRVFEGWLRHAERRPWEIVKPVWGVAVFCMALLLILAAKPPVFNSGTVKKDRASIWRSAVVEEAKRAACVAGGQKKTEKFLQAVWKGENIIDAGPCEWWGLACRYLDVSKKWLVKTQTHEMSDKPGDESFATIDLFGRKLLFANFQETHLQGANFREVQLQGANLCRTELQGADLLEVRLQGANLVRVRLQGANLVRTELQGVNLESARLQGADFASARLQGADFKNARLQGVSLKNARLQGASLRRACLQGTYLEGAELQGADLGSAQLQGSFGQPKPLSLIWAPCVSDKICTDKSSYLKKLVPNEKIATVKLPWGKFSSLKEHLQERIGGPVDYLRDNSKPNWKVWAKWTAESACKDACTARSILDSKPNWKVWAKWTAEFACKDAYTARSILERWGSKEPLSGLKTIGKQDSGKNPERYDEARAQETGEACLGPPLPSLPGLPGLKDEAKKLVRKTLKTKRENETEGECPGLHFISDDEWKELVDSWS